MNVRDLCGRNGNACVVVINSSLEKLCVSLVYAGVSITVLDPDVLAGEHTAEVGCKINSGGVTKPSVNTAVNVLAYAGITVGDRTVEVNVCTYGEGVIRSTLSLEVSSPRKSYERSDGRACGLTHNYDLGGVNVVGLRIVNKILNSSLAINNAPRIATLTESVIKACTNEALVTEVAVNVAHHISTAHSELATVDHNEERKAIALCRNVNVHSLLVGTVFNVLNVLVDSTCSPVILFATANRTAGDTTLSTCGFECEGLVSIIKNNITIACFCIDDIAEKTGMLIFAHHCVTNKTLDRELVAISGICAYKYVCEHSICYLHLNGSVTVYGKSEGISTDCTLKNEGVNVVTNLTRGKIGECGLVAGRLESKCTVCTENYYTVTCCSVNDVVPETGGLGVRVVFVVKVCDFNLVAVNNVCTKVAVVDRTCRDVHLCILTV